MISSKYIIAYNHIFNFIIQILPDNTIKVNFKSKIMTADYERAIKKSIKTVLKPKIFNGCFFILVKNYGKNFVILAYLKYSLYI